MKIFKIIFLFLFPLFLAACTSSPEPINWGKDMCAHCKMSAIDKKFGAELFTKKGKTYKFDAAECMLAYFKNGNVKQEDIAQYLVINASAPGTLTDAKTATYLISEKFPSPMGANLSAYAENSSAEMQKSKYGGTLHNWYEILNTIGK